MKLFPTFFKPKKRAKAALDSTRPNPITASYYIGAHGGPASSTFDRNTRQQAQNYCESEFLNDTTLFGACLKAASLTVGVGATLKILGPYRQYQAQPLADLESKCQFLEAEWSYYAKQTGLWQLIRLIPKELIYHGEIFLRKTKHTQIEEGFVYHLIRPERVGNPYSFIGDPFVFDGIRYNTNDGSGVPVCYYIKREYVNPVQNSIEYEEVPADQIIHLFSPILPEQRRGIPPFQSALGKIAQMRQLVRAELTAMTNAAKLGVIFSTTNEEILTTASDAGALIGKHGGETIEIPDGGLFCPPGYTPTAMDPKHPSAQFEAVKKLIGADIGATIGLGSGKINNSHEGYNYSSSKMDAQVDQVHAEVTQDLISSGVLDVIFEDWLEAFADIDPVADEFLQAARIPERVKRKWLWPAPKSLDPLKDAQTDDIRLKNGTTTYAEVYSKERKDSVEELGQWQREKEQVLVNEPDNTNQAPINEDEAPQ